MRYLEEVPDSWLWKSMRLPYFMSVNENTFYMMEFMFRRIPNWKDLVQYYANQFNTNLMWLGDA